MHETRTTYNPWAHADSLALHIDVEDIGDRLGLWDGHRIILAPDLTTREQTCVLAHEIVHAEYDDAPTPDHVWHARREARCDRIAAERLIDPHHLRDLARATQDPGQLAVELGVTGWLLEAYLKEHPWPSSRTAG